MEVMGSTLGETEINDSSQSISIREVREFGNIPNWIELLGAVSRHEKRKRAPPSISKVCIVRDERVAAIERHGHRDNASSSMTSQTCSRLSHARMIPVLR